MQRIPITQRPDLEQTALEHGFEYNLEGGVPYWDESAYYRFSLRQIEEDLERRAEEIQIMCFEVLNRALEDDSVFRRLQIPEPFWNYVADSWRNREKDLYGRMDFSYDGHGSAKLLEYNGDTPTTLYESAIFQWIWFEQAIERKIIPHNCDQFNELHEHLLEAFTHLGIDGYLHLACIGDIEDDRGTVEYIEDCAREAGLKTCFLGMEEIGIDVQGQFTDLDDRIITTLFKLYPWEWMMEEEFACHLPVSHVHFIEPPWKSVLSNKGLLPLLWEMFEGHPNLLPAYFEDDPRAASLSGNYVRKPLLSRQGWNIEIVRDGRQIFHNDGPYGREGYIVQDFHPLPKFDGNFALVGCWMVASRAAGICLREDKNWVTTEDARFVPHVIQD